MKSKFTICSVLVAALLLVLVCYALSSMPIQRLILCASDESKLVVPAKVCQYYMDGLGEKAIGELQDGAGLEFILNLNSPAKFILADQFIAKGLDVDGINHYGTGGNTPLHAAVMYGDLDTINYLLNQGASLDIVNTEGQKAKDLAEQLYGNGKKPNGPAIIALLSPSS